MSACSSIEISNSRGKMASREGMSTLRTRRLKSALDRAPDTLTADRARITTQVMRQHRDEPLIVRSLVTCAMLTFFDPELAQPYFDEATDLARSSSDFAALAQLRAYQGFALVAVGEPGAAQAATSDGLNDHQHRKGNNPCCGDPLAYSSKC